VAIHRHAIAPWPARRALPASGVVIYEETLQDTFLGDYDYNISAWMRPEEFRRWMRRLHLRDATGHGSSYERDGSDAAGCGATAEYREGVAHYHEWCA